MVLPFSALPHSHLHRRLSISIQQDLSIHIGTSHHIDVLDAKSLGSANYSLLVQVLRKVGGGQWHTGARWVQGAPTLEGHSSTIAIRLVRMRSTASARLRRSGASSGLRAAPAPASAAAIAVKQARSGVHLVYDSHCRKCSRVCAGEEVERALWMCSRTAHKPASRVASATGSIWGFQ